MQRITYTNADGESISFTESGALVLEEIDANSVGTTAATSKNAGQNGQTTTGITYNARDIRCKLGIRGVLDGKWSREVYDQFWRRITEVLLPHKVGVLEFTNGDNTYMIKCYPKELASPENKAGEYYRITVDFVADWPFWQGDFEQQLSIAPGQSAAINNPSGVDMPLIVIFSGSASNVKLLNEKNGEFLRLAQSIGTGDMLTVDTKNFEVLLNDGMRANYKLASDSTYLQLPHGTSKLSVTSDGVQPVKIKYRQVYLGV